MAISFDAMFYQWLVQHFVNYISELYNEGSGIESRRDIVAAPTPYGAFNSRGGLSIRQGNLFPRPGQRVNAIKLGNEFIPLGDTPRLLVPPSDPLSSVVAMPPIIEPEPPPIPEGDIVLLFQAPDARNATTIGSLFNSESYIVLGDIIKGGIADHPLVEGGLGRFRLELEANQRHITVAHRFGFSPTETCVMTPYAFLDTGLRYRYDEANNYSYLAHQVPTYFGMDISELGDFLTYANVDAGYPQTIVDAAQAVFYNSELHIRRDYRIFLAVDPDESPAEDTLTIALPGKMTAIFDGDEVMPGAMLEMPIDFQAWINPIMPDRMYQLYPSYFKLIDGFYTFNPASDYWQSVDQAYGPRPLTADELMYRAIFKDINQQRRNARNGSLFAEDEQGNRVRTSDFVNYILPLAPSSYYDNDKSYYDAFNELEIIETIAGYAVGHFNSVSDIASFKPVLKIRAEVSLRLYELWTELNRVAAPPQAFTGALTLPEVQYQSDNRGLRTMTNVPIQESIIYYKNQIWPYQWSEDQFEKTEFYDPVSDSLTTKDIFTRTRTAVAFQYWYERDETRREIKYSDYHLEAYGDQPDFGIFPLYTQVVNRDIQGVYPNSGRPMLPQHDLRAVDSELNRREIAFYVYPETLGFIPTLDELLFPLRAREVFIEFEEDSDTFTRTVLDYDALLLETEQGKVLMNLAGDYTLIDFLPLPLEEA